MCQTSTISASGPRNAPRISVAKKCDENHVAISRKIKGGSSSSATSVAITDKDYKVGALLEI